MSHMGGKLSRSSEKDASNSVMPRVREYRKVGDLVSQRKAGKSNPTTAPLTGIKSPDPQVSCQHRTSVCNCPQTCHYIQSIWLSAHLTCFVRKKKIKVSSVWDVNFNEITTTPPPPDPPQATMARVEWRHSKTWRQRRESASPTLTRSTATRGSTTSTSCCRSCEGTCPRPGWWPASARAWRSEAYWWPWGGSVWWGSSCWSEGERPDRRCVEAYDRNASLTHLCCAFVSDPVSL